MSKAPDDRAVLPEALQTSLNVLKDADANIPMPIAEALRTARLQALAKHASRRTAHLPLYAVLSWPLAGHGKSVFAALLLISALSLYVWSGSFSQADDAFMLGDDFPIEAFADNNYGRW